MAVGGAIGLDIVAIGLDNGTAHSKKTQFQSFLTSGVGIDEGGDGENGEIGTPNSKKT